MPGSVGSFASEDFTKGGLVKGGSSPGGGGISASTGAGSGSFGAILHFEGSKECGIGFPCSSLALLPNLHRLHDHRVVCETMEERNCLEKSVGNFEVKIDREDVDGDLIVL